MNVAAGATPVALGGQQMRVRADDDLGLGDSWVTLLCSIGTVPGHHRRDEIAGQDVASLAKTGPEVSEKRKGAGSIPALATLWRLLVRPWRRPGTAWDCFCVTRDVQARVTGLSREDPSGPATANSEADSSRADPWRRSTATWRISADTALRLARYFATTERFWMNLQGRYDLEIQRNRLAGALDEIRPLASASSSRDTRIPLRAFDQPSLATVGPASPIQEVRCPHVVLAPWTMSWATLHQVQTSIAVSRQIGPRL